MTQCFCLVQLQCMLTQPHATLNMVCGGLDSASSIYAVRSTVILDRWPQPWYQL